MRPRSFAHKVRRNVRDAREPGFLLKADTTRFFCYYISMNWSLRRQLLIISLLLILSGGVSSVFLYPVFFKKPTCFDGVKNGTEIGVDCGGGCSKICPLAEMQNVIVKFTRLIPEREGVYSVFAYVENQNPRASAKGVPYRFRLYDVRGIVIADRAGATPLYANSPVPIFEAGIRTGNNRPVRAVFDFENYAPEWFVVPREKINARLNLGTPTFEEGVSGGRVGLQVTNGTFYRMPKTEFVVALYDSQGTVFAANKTYLDLIRPKETKNIFFSWPSALPSPARIEVTPIINQFVIEEGL